MWRINGRYSARTRAGHGERANPHPIALCELRSWVPKEFRHRQRKVAAEKDVSLVEVLREVIELYEKAQGS
jgi:hypothetical protein